MAAGQRGAKLMVSYGGKIERCLGGGAEGIRYIGGEHRIVKVSRSVSLRDLRDRLAAVAGFSDFSVRYALSGEAPDALRDVATDDDVRGLLDRVLHRDLLVGLLGKDPAKIPRVRVFMVRVDAPSPPSEALAAPALLRRSETSPSLLSAKPTDDTPPSETLPAPSLMRRSATAPTSLSAMPKDDAPPFDALASPSLILRSATVPSLSAKSSTDKTAASTTTTTSSAAGSAIQDTGHGPAAFPAEQRNLVCPAPVFLLPVAPVIVYQPVIIVVPAFSYSVVVGLCHA